MSQLRYWHKYSFFIVVSGFLLQFLCSFVLCDPRNKVFIYLSWNFILYRWKCMHSFYESHELSLFMSHEVDLLLRILKKNDTVATSKCWKMFFGGSSSQLALIFWNMFEMFFFLGSFHLFHYLWLFCRHSSFFIKKRSKCSLDTTVCFYIWNVLKYFSLLILQVSFFLFHYAIFF